MTYPMTLTLAPFFPSLPFPLCPVSLLPSFSTFCPSFKTLQTQSQVVFGKVIEGLDILMAMEAVQTTRDKPNEGVVIADSGEVRLRVDPAENRVFERPMMVGLMTEPSVVVTEARPWEEIETLTDMEIGGPFVCSTAPDRSGSR